MSYRCGVGGIRSAKGWPALALAVGMVVASTGCDDGSGASTATPEVAASGAFIAVIDWEVSEYEPMVNEDGDVELPVVYVAPAGGGTIDVGIQAAVVEATVETAIVRFADEAGEALDSDVEGEPVKDDGVLLIVGDMPEPSRTIELGVVRYQSVDDDSILTVTIRAVGDGDGAEVVSTLKN
jgi:hypothetical protein